MTTHIALFLRQQALNENVPVLIQDGLTASGVVPAAYTVSLYNIDFTSIPDAYNAFVSSYPPLDPKVIVVATTPDLIAVNALIGLGSNAFVIGYNATAQSFATLSNGISFSYTSGNYIENIFTLVSGTDTKKLAIIYDINDPYGVDLAAVFQQSYDIIPVKKYGVFTYELVVDNNLLDTIDEFYEWASDSETVVIFVGSTETVTIGINSLSDVKTKNITWILTDLNQSVGDVFGNQTVLAALSVPVDYSETSYALYKKYRPKNITTSFYLVRDIGFIVGSLINLGLPINFGTISTTNVFLTEPAAFLTSNEFNPQTRLLRDSANDFVYTKEIINIDYALFEPSFLGNVARLPNSVSAWAKVYNAVWLSPARLAVDFYVFDTYYIRDCSVPIFQRFDNILASYTTNGQTYDLSTNGNLRQGAVVKVIPGARANNLYPTFSYIKLLEPYEIPRAKRCSCHDHEDVDPCVILRCQDGIPVRNLEFSVANPTTADN